MNVDLHTFLNEMSTLRESQKKDLADLGEKIEAGFKEHTATLAEHDTRLVVVEGTRKTLRWLAVTAIGAILVGAVDLVFNHFKG